MRSRQLFLTCMAVLLLMPMQAAYAQEGELSDKEKQKILEDAQEQLYAAEWTIKVTPMWGKKEDRKSTTDVLELVNGKLHSKNFEKEGYEDSNATITVGDDGMIVLETMQRNNKGGIIFWRGELIGDALRGVISQQIPEQDALSYSFSGSQTGTVTPPQPEPEPVLIPDAPVAAESAELEAEVSEASESEVPAEAEPVDASGEQENLLAQVFSQSRD